MSGGRHLVLQHGDEAFDVRPLIATAGDLEGPPAHELERAPEEDDGVGRRLVLGPTHAFGETLVVTPDRVGELVHALPAGQQREIGIAVG